MSHKDLNSVNAARPKRVAIVISNPAVSTTSGWPVGFWWGELTHPYFHFTFWLNIVFLACVAFLPFPTALLGQYGAYRSAVVTYGFSLVVTGLLLDGMRWYATRGRRLVAPDLEERLVRSAKRRNLMGPAIYLVAIMVALLPIHSIHRGAVGGAQIALALYVVVPLLYILPGRIDMYWASGHGRGHVISPTDDSVPPTAPESETSGADAEAQAGAE